MPLYASRWMTPDQRSAFRESGYVLLRGALHRNQVEPIRRHVVDELKRLKIWASGKTLSASIKKAPAFQQIAKLSRLLQQDRLDARVSNDDTISAIASLAETRLVAAQSKLLVSLPNQGAWTLNGLSWHIDISPTGHEHVPGIQAFILIDDVRPRGGATLALAGSHCLAGQPSKRVREILRTSGDLQNELRRYDLSVVEMSGHAGDVYLMDMRLLHTPSINSTNKLRIMATVRYFPAAHSSARAQR